jgi:hypothetical protein
MQANLGQKTWAPSAVPLDLESHPAISALGGKAFDLGRWPER